MGESSWLCSGMLCRAVSRTIIHQTISYSSENNQYIFLGYSHKPSCNLWNWPLSSLWLIKGWTHIFLRRFIRKRSGRTSYSLLLRNHCHLRIIFVKDHYSLAISFRSCTHSIATRNYLAAAAELPRARKTAHARQPKFGWCDRSVMCAARRRIEVGDVIIRGCEHGFSVYNVRD
jgi:hypothetical protein